MSGICGIVRLDGKPVDPLAFQKFFDAMKNRGSDREKSYVQGSVAFGHKALWSTPEAVHEMQPLKSKDGRYILAADARIDNRETLFNELGIEKKEDHIITDADLVLLAWETWKEECTTHLIGDFAFAVYDTMEEALFFTRDHVGIRPFYYVLTDTLFCFASEIMPLFKIEGIEKELDPKMEEKYLQCRYLDYDETFFKGVKRFRPGSYGVLKKGSLHFERYWFPENIKIDTKISFEEATQKFRELFTEAVQCRMRSISPIGCELSGGLDSSSVFAVAATLEKKENPIIPISERFGKMHCDESYYSDLMVKKTGHLIETVRIDTLDFQHEYSLHKHYKRFKDWPQAGFFIGIYPVSQCLQNRGVHVLLTGQGGDHLTRGSGYVMVDYFKGFQWIKIFKELRYWNNPFGTIKRTILKTLVSKKLLKIYQYFNHSSIPQQCKKYEFFKIYQNMNFAFSDDLETVVGAANVFALDQFAYHDMEFFGLESRHPFFDKRVVEYLLGLPTTYKLYEGFTKRILRKAMEKMLPGKILYRKDKADFSEMLQKQIEGIQSKEEISKNSIITEKNQYMNYSYNIWSSK